MASTAVDWSWGQAYKTSSFGAPPTPPEEPFSQERRLKDALSFVQASPAKDFFANGYTINEFRTAVPSPATKAEMSDLSLQRAAVPRPNLDQFQRKPSFAGRKRSCAEMSSEEDSSSPASLSDDVSASPTKVIRLENGEQMDADTMDATGGSGVWAEELAERLRSSSFPDGSLRPRIPESRKSARVEPESSMDAINNAAADSHMAIDGASADMAGLVRARTLSVHDEARIALGVGWASIPATPIMLAAARGWSRFIEMNFGLRNVRVVWRNEGLAVLLVSAVTSNFSTQGRELPGTPGYYLLDENLTQGRLVAKSWEKCLDCLRSKPIAFEGEAIMPLKSEQASCGTTELIMGSAAEDRPLGMEID